MQILVDGNKEQAYHLILDKKQAIEILNGKRKVVIIPYNGINERVFFGYDVFDEFWAKAESDPNFEGNINDHLRDIWHIRFSEYSDKWHLNVELDEISFEWLDKETVERLNSEYDFHELDDEWQQYSELGSNEQPNIFCLVLGKVISHSGLN